MKRVALFDFGDPLVGYERHTMESFVTTLLELYRAVHQQLREEIRELAPEALHWTPGPETNSIATLIVHTLGSEAEVLHVVRGRATNRNRAAEFVPGNETAADLIRQIDAADTLLDEIGRGITSSDLAATRPRGDRPPQTGLYWLLSNYGHAREHLAHLQLTKQLYQLGRKRDAV